MSGKLWRCNSNFYLQSGISNISRCILTFAAIKASTCTPAYTVGVLLLQDTHTRKKNMVTKDNLPRSSTRHLYWVPGAWRGTLHRVLGSLPGALHSIKARPGSTTGASPICTRWVLIFTSERIVEGKWYRDPICLIANAILNENQINLGMGKKHGVSLKLLEQET